jgi:hypothetical protein
MTSYSLPTPFIMAFYIWLNKKFEDNAIAIYEFGTSNHKSGRLQLDKVNEEVTELNSIPNVNSEM